MWPFGSSDQSPQTGTSKSRADDSQADSELADLVRSFQTSESTEPTRAKQLVAPSAAIGGIAPPITETKTETLQDGRRVYEDGTIDITPDHMHPRSMSCRQAFDQAYYCQSLGGKFNDIYRYGGLKSCSEQWAAFRFCMRTRTLGEAERERQTVDHYRARDAKRKAEHGSSEDVWEIRTRSVREAFGKDPDAANAQQMTAQS